MENSYEDELNQIKKHNKIIISLVSDINIENGRIEIIEASKTKKGNKKTSPIKAIKKQKKTRNKKTGWWQT